jgi:hypothetical protein
MPAGSQHKTDIATVVAAIATAKTNLVDPSKNSASSEADRAGLARLYSELDAVINREKFKVQGLV